MPTQYIAKSQAYATAVLHALQHPSQTVLGVLAGKVLDDNSVEILATYPILHSNHTLKPLTDVALLQIKEAAAAKGWSLVGSYAANERLNDNNPNEVGRSIAGRNATAVFWHICNAEVGQATKRTSCVKPYRRAPPSVVITHSHRKFVDGFPCGSGAFCAT